MKLLGLMMFMLSGCFHSSGNMLSNTVTPTTEIVTEEIDYKYGAKNMKGFLAMPKNLQNPTPGVLVVHEWWGQTEYPRERARKLAQQGYIAFAVDMYGKGSIANHPKKAGEFSGAIMKNAATVAGPFEAALTALKAVPNVDVDRLAAIGYCFGGSVVLEMARQGNEELDIVASFHGGLMTPSKAEKGKIKANILVFNGAADPFVKKEQITAFKEEMDAAGAAYEFKNYEGAVHGFTNPEATKNGKKFSLPLSYDPQADQQSWNAMLNHFRKYL